MQRSHLLVILVILPFVLYSKENPKNRNISGKVYIPENQPTLSGKLRIKLVLTKNTDKNFSKKIYLDLHEDKKEYFFNFNVDYSRSELYRIRFFISAGRYLRSGYYSPGRIIPFHDNNPSIWIDLSMGDVKNIKIPLIRDESAMSTEELQKEGKKVADRLVETLIHPRYTDFEKIIVFHDYILNNFNYFNEKIAAEAKLPSFEDVHTDFIPFIYKVGLCGTFSSSFGYLLNQAGVQTHKLHLLTGDHAWNLVKLDGEYYHIDTTDNRTNSIRGYEGGNYFIFLRNDSQMKSRWKEKSHQAKRQFKFRKEYYVHKKELRDPDYIRFFGQINLPEGETAPAGGTTVLVNGVKHIIPAGSNYVFLAYRVKRNAVNFSLIIEFSGTSYYYSRKGLVKSKREAEIFDMSGDDVTDISFRLIKN